MSADDYLELMQDRDEWRKKCDAQVSEIAALKAQLAQMESEKIAAVTEREIMERAAQLAGMVAVKERDQRIAELEAQLADRDAEVERLREKHKTLHRRAQEAEAAIPSYKKLIAVPPDGAGVRFVNGSRGRALLSSLCSELNAEVVELKAMLEWIIQNRATIRKDSVGYITVTWAQDGRYWRITQKSPIDAIREAMAAQEMARQ